MPRDASVFQSITVDKLMTPLLTAGIVAIGTWPDTPPLLIIQRASTMSTPVVGITKPVAVKLLPSLITKLPSTETVVALKFGMFSIST